MSGRARFHQPRNCHSWPPKGLAQSRELHYAPRVLSTIELNGSFYSLQWPTSYTQWADDTPEGFVFAVKGSRYTHEELTRWAALTREWTKTGDVFCYFDNTDKLHAPDNAQELMEMLGLRVPWQPADQTRSGSIPAARGSYVFER